MYLHDEIALLDFEMTIWLNLNLRIWECAFMNW